MRLKPIRKPITHPSRNGAPCAGHYYRPCKTDRRPLIVPAPFY
uniref:Uncharacterized protein n=1 Tax=Neisseria meningitidis alpha275 TaxID=295996 RepID=C6SLA0_NEIME|nr:hypothetical protein predicted by Glimmer/Critica [Neisseria meningitidis alpha275]